MSHRDSSSRTGTETCSQELTAILRGLCQQADWSGVAFREDCRWSPCGLAMAAILWSWSSHETLGARLEQALRITRGLGRRFAPVQTSYQAFLKLVVRWTKELRAALAVVFQRAMEAEWSLLGLWGLLLHAQQEHQREFRAPARLSVARVLRRRPSPPRTRPSARTGADVARPLAGGRDRLLPPPKQNQPRLPAKKYEPPTKPPRLQTATRTQREAAKQILSQKARKGLTA